MRDTIEMAREADLIDDTYASDWYVYQLKAFEALVRADERDKAIEETHRRANASWTRMCEKMVAAERESCAKVCEAKHTDGRGHDAWGWMSEDYAEAIRSRGTHDS
jgi:hypothetical protein